MTNPLPSLRSSLRSHADVATRTTFQRFFKEEVKFYGVRSGTVAKIAKDYFAAIKDSGKKRIFGLCEELFKSGISEESWIAANWAYWIRKQFTSDDFKIFERWVNKYVHNWAACDTLCNHAVGALVEMYPQCITGLKKWAKSKNRWLKRAAAVTLIIPAKEGKFLQDIFTIAHILLLDPDDMVQKGYGWMLKEAGRNHQKEVFGYVMKNRAVMPRTALRYAIEKMSPDLRKRAMAKG
jgi:3-methyladenine DNA glycosylase AlkD